MSEARAYDAVVIGAGPNGLAAAIEMARAGCSAVIFEAAETIGGGARSDELTLPGFTHDLCSAIQSFAGASPFMRSLPLAEHGLELIHSPAPLAHPFDDGTAVTLERSTDATAETLDRQDKRAYRSLMTPLVEAAGDLLPFLLSPPSFPQHPFLAARFGLRAMRSAYGFAQSRFAGARARSFFAGLSAHSILPLENFATAAFGLVLGVSGHAFGWPVARGGSQAVADAMASYLRSLGGEIVTGRRIESLAELPPARAILCDVTPRQLLKIAGERLPAGYRRRLERYRYGPAAFKLDWALDGPIPWRARECARAATVHLGATIEEIAASERAAWRGRRAEKPFVLLAQQSLFDETRAPAGKHTVWAYCHIPNGSTFDMTERIENQIERFAPGFRDLILARRVTTPADFERRNPNIIGGDINGGAQDIRQLFARPVFRLTPYSTPVKGLYICSSSTPPGGGVHGMCGYHAARAALKRLRNRDK